jgi:hypothetical protein
MEALTRLVADSLARHGLDRPVDPRRLQWSRWFRCDSPHSLLVVPSKPGIFAIAEEVMNLGPGNPSEAGKIHVETAGKIHVETAAPGCPERSSVIASSAPTVAGSAALVAELPLGGAALQRCDSQPPTDAASAAEAPTRRMLAVLQFSEDDDMAFTLDRMFTRVNPLRARLASGGCFLRFVVIEDGNQLRSICAALNQWMQSSSEKGTGLPADLQSSLELTNFARVGAGDSPARAGNGTPRVGRTLLSDTADSTRDAARTTQPKPDTKYPAPYPDSGANKNLHCPHPLPSGF